MSFDGVVGYDVSFARRKRKRSPDAPTEEQVRKGATKSRSKKRLKSKHDEITSSKNRIREELEDKNKRKTKSGKDRKKHTKKTVGVLLKEGDTSRARKKVERLKSKLPAIIESEPATATLMPINSENEFLEEYYHIYSTLGSIIRKLEDRMTDENSSISGRDVYALMTMYSQMRETIADLRSIKDMSAQAEELTQLVFDPLRKSAGETLLNLYFRTTTSVRQKVTKPEVLEEILERLKIDFSEQANRLQEQFDVANMRVSEVLNGRK